LDVYGLRHASNVMLIQIGQGAQLIGRASQGVASIFGSTVACWCSRKQTFVALSTTETEYIAVCMAVCEAVWLRKLLVDFSIGKV
jgi:hypothetical protein